VATLGVVKRETNSWGWTAIMFTYMTVLAYLASFATYNTAVAFGLG
jgi:ferrous iron transport protein B